MALTAPRIRCVCAYTCTRLHSRRFDQQVLQWNTCLNSHEIKTFARTEEGLIVGSFIVLLVDLLNL